MKIALIGYGKMGKEIEKIAIERGHQITARISSKNHSDIGTITKENTEVAIEFTSPKSAFKNINTLLDKNIKVISGSTGWLDDLGLIKKKVSEQKGTFFYATNYSPGVNITFRLNEILAKMMNEKEYKASIEEIHHVHKLDSPSGTGITLAEGIINNIQDISSWESGTSNDESILPILSKREGEVSGTHTVIYDSQEDSIALKHTAHSRRGFALGAVLVTEWIQNKLGFLTMNDYFDFSV